MNIPIDETGEFLQRSHTQEGFEPSAEAQQPHNEGKCEEEKYDEEEENGIDSGPSLFLNTHKIQEKGEFERGLPVHLVAS